MKVNLEDLIKEDDSQVSVHFDSATDLLGFDSSQITRNENREKFDELTKDKTSDPWHGSDWYGHTNKNNADVIHHALVGDAELLKDLEEKIEALDKATGKNTNDYKQIIKVVKRRSIMTDEGDELDIDKVYAGEFDTCWRKTIREQIGQEQKLVTLFVNIGGLSAVTPEQSFWRSAVAVRITNELEAAGKVVKILVGSGTTGFYSNGKVFTGSITAKQYNERISMERLAAMTHIGFHRTFGFAVKCCTNYRSNLGTMGRPKVVNNNFLPLSTKEEIESGKTRFVHIEPCVSEAQAVHALENCYSQLKDLSEAA